MYYLLSLGQKMLPVLFVIFFLNRCFAILNIMSFETESQLVLENSLNEMNLELLKLNSILSQLSWKLATEPDSVSTSEVTKFGTFQIKWRNKWCHKLNKIFKKYIKDEFDKEDMKVFEKKFRQFYLLCRGPVYNAEENGKLIKVLNQLESVYETSRVCIDDHICLRGEPDLERIMMESRDPNILLWAWVEWRNTVGPPSRKIYPNLVSVLNEGARNNGYREIGECWREELEVDNLEALVEDLYKQIKPLYMALHAVVRYKLNLYYGSDLVKLDEPLPAHLLGNMWAQNWGSLLDIIVDIKQEETLTYNLIKKNYTVMDLVNKAEDFFVSLGFKPMTEAFWKYSKFDDNSKNGSTCHGTAANMFRPNDFRIILCAKVNEEDFSVIHHEMGHIEYYMEYENQPAIFQEGVNSAFQETIGDAVMLGVVSPAHLQRLGLISEIETGIDLKLLLRQALIKIPQIPFGLMLEKWRWNVFKRKILPENYNEAWWALREQYQGVKPPTKRNEQHFDPSAKFHINDNKPYIRYFLASILQMQIFESLCKSTIYGEISKNETLPFPLYKCDIYGSQKAAKNLRQVMFLGNSIGWKEALKMITGEDSYSVRPLWEYYQPLYKWLLKEIKEKNIPVGWSSFIDF